MNTSLTHIYKATKVIETIENYSLSDDYSLRNTELPRRRGELVFYDDRHFWNSIINDPEKYWNKKISLVQFVYSNWIPRIPGLYWASFSEKLRKHSIHEVAITSNEWVEFNPPGKSRKVMGGIGSITLPANDEGKRLISLSSSCNASLGIPALVFPDVYEGLNLKDGDALNILHARWQPMDITWSKRFASTHGMPRGCLIVDSIEKASVHRTGIPVVYHPYSVMEYEVGDALLYDFVYLQADNKVKNVRKELESFFNYYANKDGRHGRYLLNPDMIQPLFEAQYNAPHEMNQGSERAKVELILKRIAAKEFKRTTLDKLIEKLPSYYTTSLSIRRLAKSVGISPSILHEDSAASMSAQLINHSFDRNKIDELTDRMSIEYPQIFNI